MKACAGTAWAGTARAGTACAGTARAGIAGAVDVEEVNAGDRSPALLGVGGGA